MTLPYSLCQSCKGTVGFGQAVVKILADRGIIGHDATLVGKVLHCVKVDAVNANMRRCVKVDAVNANMRRTVRFTWRGLVQHLSLLQADSEAEVLRCIREGVDDVL